MRDRLGQYSRANRGASTLRLSDSARTEVLSVGPRVSGELESRRFRDEQAALEHQLCLADWRKVAADRLKKLEGYTAEKQHIGTGLQQSEEAGPRSP